MKKTCIYEKQNQGTWLQSQHLGGWARELERARPVWPQSQDLASKSQPINNNKAEKYILWPYLWFIKLLMCILQISKVKMCLNVVFIVINVIIWKYSLQTICGGTYRAVLTSRISFYSLIFLFLLISFVFKDIL